jgi:outer membrane immunogenic protein
MKTLASTVAAMALMVGSALAADLPSRKGPPALPPPPPPPMWTGFYAGLNAGYGFGTNSNVQSAAIGQDAYVGNLPGDWERAPRPANPERFYYQNAFNGGSLSMPTGVGFANSGVFSNTQSGFIGGGQIGYNYQWGSNFVIGVEADIQGTGIRGSSHGIGAGVGSAGYDSANYVCDFNTDSGKCQPANNNTNRAIKLGYPGFQAASNATGVTSVNAGVDWMGTVRGRLGYLFTPTMLLYATGGLTYGGVYANVHQYAASSISANSLSYMTVNPLENGAQTPFLVSGGSLGGAT